MGFTLNGFGLILTSVGTVDSFGINNYGQLGLDDNTDRDIPTLIQNHTDVIAISCGNASSAILKSDGTVYTFGRNNTYQLGLGDNTDRDIPTLIQNHTNVTAISMGGSLCNIKIRWNCLYFWF